MSTPSKKWPFSKITHTVGNRFPYVHRFRAQLSQIQLRRSHASRNRQCSSYLAPHEEFLENVERIGCPLRPPIIPRIMKEHERTTAIMNSGPTEFGKFLGDETEKWAKVIRTNNIKVE